VRAATQSRSVTAGSVSEPEGGDLLMATADGGEAVDARTHIAARLARVRARVDDAARAAGREPSEVRLVAISKFQPLEAIRAAFAAGQMEFGENRAQELVAKLPAAPPGARWHFVGSLQRNKVKQVVGHVELIHSVDRVPLAEAIAAQAGKSGQDQRVLVQVNVAGEQAKGGCAPGALPALLARIAELDGVSAVGFMTIPPLAADPTAMFERLRALRAHHEPRFPGLVELSMGMSADLEAAVGAGATIVRVGTAIFGVRPRNR
jgi:PLP dependent protein